MRIDPRFSAVPLSSTAPQRSVSGQRFTLDGSGDARGAGRTAASAPLGTLDALLAVQGEGDPAERRRRSLKRGHDLLDSLDKLKAALLSGRVGQMQLRNLAAQIRSQGGSSGDPGLDEVVAHIELRAQVEMAKLARV
jgi:Class II flagellar assembly regulator